MAGPAVRRCGDDSAALWPRSALLALLGCAAGERLAGAISLTGETESAKYVLLPGHHTVPQCPKLCADPQLLRRRQRAPISYVDHVPNLQMLSKNSISKT